MCMYCIVYIVDMQVAGRGSVAARAQTPDSRVHILLTVACLRRASVRVLVTTGRF